MSDVERCAVEYPHLRHEHRGSSGRYVRCPGIPIDPATRAQPPTSRHEIVAELRRIKDQLQRLVNEWDVDGRVWTGSEPRPRQLDEFPENNPRAWSELQHRVAVLSNSLAVVGGRADWRGSQVREFRRKRAERAAASKLEG